MKYNISQLTSIYTENDFYFFWRDIPVKNGEITKSCLSQWWKSDFQY